MKRILFFALCLAFSLLISIKPACAYDLALRHDVFTPAFQLVWNDFKEFVSLKRINFRGIDPRVAYVLNANKFTADDISENSYYKVAAPKSYEWKAKIQREIMEKIGQKSKNIG